VIGEWYQILIIDLIIIFMTNEDAAPFFTIYGTVNNLFISSTGRKKRGSGYKATDQKLMNILHERPDPVFRPAP